MDPAVVSVWIPIVLAVIGAVFAALKMWDDYRREKRLRDAALAAQLSNAVKNAVGIVQQTGSLDAGVRYVENQAEESVERYVQTPGKIAEKVTAQIGLGVLAADLASVSGSVAASLSPSPPGTTAADLNAAELERIQRGGRV